MRVSYTINDRELRSSRYLKVTTSNNPKYAIKPDGIYDPIREFFADYQ